MKLQIEKIVRDTVHIDVESVKRQTCKQLESRELINYSVVEDVIWANIWAQIRKDHVAEDILDLSDEASMQLTVLIDDIIDELELDLDTGKFLRSDTD